MIKKTIIALTVTAMLATTAVSAAEPAKKYLGTTKSCSEINIPAGTENAGKMFGVLAVTKDAVSGETDTTKVLDGASITDDKIIYIDQVTSDKDGKITIPEFTPIDKNVAPTPEDPNPVAGYLYMGGGAYDVAQHIAILYAGEKPTPTGVKVSGRVIFQDSPVGATVTVTERETSISKTVNNVETNVDYSVENVPAGTYDIMVTKPAYCSYTKKGIVVSNEDVALGNIDISTLAGDIDSSDSIDIDDLGLLLDDFNKETADLEYAYSDIDASGAVDIDDLGYILDSFNNSSIEE